MKRGYRGADVVIHPLALVADGASLAGGCRVGPFCTIGEDVDLGPGTVLESGVTLSGRTKIGSRNRFFPGVVIGMPPQLAEDCIGGGIQIGDDNIFREGVTIQGGISGDEITVLGDNNRLLTNSHVGHDGRVGSGVTLSNNVAVAGHVTIEDGAYLSGLVSVHQFVRIGALSFISANSFVDRSVLPYTIAAGNRVRIRAHNRVGLSRAGWSNDRIEIVRNAVRQYHVEGAKLLRGSAGDDEAIRAWSEFLRSDVRGIARPGFLYRRPSLM